MKRFYISAWTSFEAYQYNRPPAVIISVLEKTAGQAQAAVKNCYAARGYIVFDASETPVACEAVYTFEEWRNSRQAS